MKAFDYGFELGLNKMAAGLSNLVRAGSKGALASRLAQSVKPVAQKAVGSEPIMASLKNRLMGPATGEGSFFARPRFVLPGLGVAGTLGLAELGRRYIPPMFSTFEQMNQGIAPKEVMEAGE